MTSDRLNADKFWERKRILITGHTGFKGAWLTLTLATLGADITGISRGKSKNDVLFRGANVKDFCRDLRLDIRNRSALDKLIKSESFEIVFHLAAQSLVKVGTRRPRETYDTNLWGTVNLLDRLRTADTISACVIATTDKVYLSRETKKHHREVDPLGASDAYGLSKVCADVAAQNYSAMSGYPPLAIVRAGNVIGGGDFAEYRLIPDIIRAVQSNSVMRVRMPYAIRPWQHVLEPIFAYLQIGKLLYEGREKSGIYNIGPIDRKSLTVSDILQNAREKFPNLKYRLEKEVDQSLEAKCLRLDSSKFYKKFKVSPIYNQTEAVDATMKWYRGFLDGESQADLVQADISHYLRNRAI